VIDLSGKAALVTGASKGIGFATARLFAECGASVMLSSRKQENLETAGTQMVGEFDLYAANAGDPVQAEECVARTIARFGGLDILVNNAGTSPYFGPLIDADVVRFDKTMSVNLRGPLVWTQAAWRQAMKARGGNVINIGSIGASSYNGPLGVYQTS
jgi:NAD(P)-dependent dehydrogenase (short-subunit alcohol dehydrogenase family)